MESFRTMFRLIVMLVAIYFGYLGWQRFGPPADRLKSIAQRALEIAQSALGDENQVANGTARLAADPQAAAPPLAPPAPAIPGPNQQSQAVVMAEASAPGEEPANLRHRN